MQRFLMEELLEWKNKNNRKPLILKGARQVGKTWLMKEFGKLHFEKCAYVSFYNNQRMYLWKGGEAESITVVIE